MKEKRIQMERIGIIILFLFSMWFGVKLSVFAFVLSGFAMGLEGVVFSSSKRQLVLKWIILGLCVGLVKRIPLMIIWYLSWMLGEILVCCLNFYASFKKKPFVEEFMSLKMMCYSSGSLILLFFYQANTFMVNLLIFLHCLVCFAICLIRFKAYFHWHPKILMICSGAYVVFLVGGALGPFLIQPEVSATTQETFDLSSFTEINQEKEYAKVIEDNGKALEERIRLIAQAKEEIILSTFEFDADRSGQQMLAALLDASQRGVKISILVDGFPYLKAMLANPYFLALSQQDKVTIKQYNPISLIRPFGFMGRMHDKYLIVDDLGYIMGGRNTYDYFLGDQEGYKNYDWDIYVLGHTSIGQLKDYFYQVWNLDVCQEMRSYAIHPAVQQAQEKLEHVFQTMKRDHPDWFVFDVKGMVPVDDVTLISNPTHIYAKEPTAFYAMTELMRNANDSVMIHTPYIICNDYMLERLAEIDHATMMTNSVVNNGNPFGAMDYQMNKEKIVETGVSILEYEQGISYHGKCFTIDDTLTGIGSFNWDMRSAYLDTEVMLIVNGKELNEQCRKLMKVYEDEALQVKDSDTYQLKEGQVKKELSLSQVLQLKLIQIFGGWARFLM